MKAPLVVKELQIRPTGGNIGRTRIGLTEIG